MLTWSLHNNHWVAISGPYCLRVHKYQDRWLYQCYIFADRGKETWFDGSGPRDQIKQRRQAQSRATKAMKAHIKSK